MRFRWEESRRAFREAASWFTTTTAAVGDRWDRPGLGAWDVRSLVGHTSRALLTVEEYLFRPAPRVTVASSVGYYLATRELARSPQVEARGRDAGRALGGDPVHAVEGLAARVVALVDGRDGTELLTTVAGGMTLAEYLPTRTFELVVHTCDLARALGVVPEPPAAAADQALRVVAELAGEEGAAATLLLAATGRMPLPEGFSVL